MNKALKREDQKKSMGDQCIPKRDIRMENQVTREILMISGGPRMGITLILKK